MKTNEQNIDISTTTMRNDPDDTPRSASDDMTLEGQTADGNMSGDASGTSEMASAAAGRTLAEIISDVAEQELAQYPPVSMTPEQLEAMVARRRDARKAAEEAMAGNANEAADKTADVSADRTDGETASKDASSVMDEIAASTDMEEMIDGTPDEAAIGISVSAAGRAAKKRRTLRIAGLAAVLMLALVGALLLLNTLTTDVGANKNEKEEIVTEDGVIIEDGGWGSSEDEESYWLETEWEHVHSAKTVYPQILIPGYIPDSYTFEQMSIEILETEDIICEYLFLNENNKTLEIEQYIQKNGVISLNINDISRTIESSKGMIYIQEYDNKIATIQLDDGCISVRSNLFDKEIVKIVNRLEY